MHPAAVIFDMDGVLVDSAAAHRESWQALGKERGRPISDEEFHATFGRSSRDIIRILFGDAVSDAEAKAMDERKESLYRELIRGRVPIMPGAPELVRALHDASLRIAIGSSGPKENIALVVEALGIGALLAGVVNGMDVERGKPDPQVFLLAASRVGLEPARCVVVEDAPAGIEAAHRAGMPAIALSSSHPAEALAKAELTVSKLSEITAARVHALLGDFR